MARSRNIKPAIMGNEELAELEPLTRLLFIYLWMLADREGRLEDRPKRIAAQALPYDREADIVDMLGDLSRGGFIQRYTVGDLSCIQIVNFEKHQAPHLREAASELPKYEQSTAKAVTKHNLGSAEASPRSPDSLLLIPDSLLLNAEVPALPVPTPKKAKSQKSPMPDSFSVSDRVRAWAKEKGFSQLEQHLEAFTRKVAMNGYTYADWDSALMEAIREDWAKLRGKMPNGVAPPPEPKNRDGPDPALQKIREDDKKAAPIPANIRAQIAQLTTMVKT